MSRVTLEDVARESRPWLTPARSRVLEAIMRVTERDGNAGTRAVADDLGLCHQGIAQTIHVLAERGYVTRVGRNALRVLKDPEGRAVRLRYESVEDVARG